MSNKQTASNKDLLALEHDKEPKKSPFLINNERESLKNAKPNITKPEVSSLLSRVKDFLPKIDEANKQLQQQVEATNNTKQFDIENVDEEKPHIEMDLALGVLEQKASLEDTLVINPNAPKIPEGVNLIEQLSSEDEDEDEDEDDQDEEMQQNENE